MITCLVVVMAVALVAQVWCAWRVFAPVFRLVSTLTQSCSLFATHTHGQLWAQPYAERRHNRIEVALMIIVLLVFLAGIGASVELCTTIAVMTEKNLILSLLPPLSRGCVQ